MRINILNYYIKEIINFNNYYHFYGNFPSHIYNFFLILNMRIILSLIKITPVGYSFYEPIQIIIASPNKKYY